MLRILQVVKKCAAKTYREEPVVGDVRALSWTRLEFSRLVFDLMLVAGRHVPAREPRSEDLKSHAREPDRVPAFKQPTSARRRWLLSPGKTVSRVPHAEMRQDDSSNVREAPSGVKVPSSRRTLWADCTAPANVPVPSPRLAPSAGPGFCRHGQARQPRRNREGHIHEPPAARRRGELAPLGLEPPRVVSPAVLQRQRQRSGDGARWFPAARRAPPGLERWRSGEGSSRP